LKQIYLILILVLIPLAFAGICQDEESTTDLPCEVITPEIEGACGVYNYTITYDNGTLAQVGIASALGDNTYNFTFNHTHISGYSIVLCENSTGSINVVLGDNTRYLYIFTLLLIGAIFLLGIYLNDSIFTLLSGMLTTIFAIYVYVNGLIDFTSPLMSQAFLMIMLGLGFIVIGVSAYKLMSEGW